MKKKVIIASAGIFVAIIIGISTYFYHVFSVANSYNDKIYPGVKIEGIDMSNKTKDEAKKILSQKYQDAIGNKKVNIQVKDNVYSITYSKLDAKYDIDNIIAEAFSYGKSQSTLGKYKLIKKPISKSYNFKFTYNSKPLDDLITSIGNDVNKKAVEGKITKNDSSFVITPDSDGYKLNDTQLKKDILNSINDKIGADTNVKASIDTVKANATKEKLQGVNTLISTYNTDYASISSSGRCTNIQLATNAINGLCLMPGDSFSFNGTVGERTAAKGYQPAPVDIGNKTGTGLGGGICEVSTTLYNAMLLAGVKSTNRNHHSIPSVYVPLGRDATVDYGNLDYGFKNTYNFPIYIEGSTDNGYITFNIYSDNSLTSKTYQVENDVYEILQPTTEYVNDAALPKGTTQIDQNGVTGHKVRVYLETFQNGNMISKETISDDTYSAVNTVIRKGTK